MDLIHPPAGYPPPAATGIGRVDPATCPVWCDLPHTAYPEGLISHQSIVDQLAVAADVSVVVLLVWLERTGEREQSEPPHVALVTTGSGADNMLQLTPEQAGQLADITHISGASPWLAKALAVAAVVLAPPVTT